MSTDPPDTYGYEELATRIEQVLGERPSRSALRAEPAQARRTGATMARPRVTAGMPTPLPASSRTSPALFAADEVEAWLTAHPRLAWNRAMAQMQRRLAQGEDVEAVISKALGAGLSWRHITTALNAHDGRQRSTAGVHKRYRRLAASRSAE